MARGGDRNGVAERAALRGFGDADLKRLALFALDLSVFGPDVDGRIGIADVRDFQGCVFIVQDRDRAGDGGAAPESAQIQLGRFDLHLDGNLSPERQGRDRAEGVVGMNADVFGLLAGKPLGVKRGLNSALGAGRDGVRGNDRGGAAARGFDGLHPQIPVALIGKPKIMRHLFALFDPSEIEHGCVNLHPRAGKGRRIGVCVRSGDDTETGQ